MITYAPTLVIFEEGQLTGRYQNINANSALIILNAMTGR